jgi:hypothetical protein
LGAHGTAFEAVPGIGEADRNALHLVRVEPQPGHSHVHFWVEVGTGRLASHRSRSPDTSSSQFNDNAFAFVVDAGFPLRSSEATRSGSLVARFDGNEARDKPPPRHSSPSIASMPRRRCPMRWAPGSTYAALATSLFATSGELDEGSTPADVVWIDHRSLDPAALDAPLDNRLRLSVH